MHACLPACALTQLRNPCLGNGASYGGLGRPTSINLRQSLIDMSTGWFSIDNLPSRLFCWVILGWVTLTSNVSHYSGYTCLLLSFWEMHSWVPQWNGGWLSTTALPSVGICASLFMLLHTLLALQILLLSLFLCFSVHPVSCPVPPHPSPSVCLSRAPILQQAEGLRL